METFTYDELRMIRDALNELDQAITPETSVFNPLMDKLDRMIQSKDKGQYSLYDYCVKDAQVTFEMYKLMFPSYPIIIIVR